MAAYSLSRQPQSLNFDPKDLQCMHSSCLIGLGKVGHEMRDQRYSGIDHQSYTRESKRALKAHKICGIRVVIDSDLRYSALNTQVSNARPKRRHHRQEPQIRLNNALCQPYSKRKGYCFLPSQQRKMLLYYGPWQRLSLQWHQLSLRLLLLSC